ncbi:MAG: hypothetical protein KIT72_15545 [Polyangiaceae bacterium]|nr:hypothetical protein [Polyangiaceae bacterium]MCW5791829.1 hypothetical protein [Polyangiaceae bacterium]
MKVPALVALSLLLVSAPAFAFEAGTLGDELVQVDVTQATSLLYNADNRDARPNDVTRLANDDWGMLYNRLNIQGSAGSWQLGLRLDTAWFYTSPNPVDIATRLERSRPRPLDPAASSPADYFRQRFYESGGELSNRYINWTYPAKYYVGYSTRDVELTLGDFYAQFGRGLVLSVRKLDELSSDVTLRGARATSYLDAGDARLKLTLLGGELNPLRIDDASGRVLGVTSDVTPGFLSITEAGMPRDVATDFSPVPRATYAPDRLLGAQIEAAPPGVKLGTQAVMLIRQDALNADVVRSSDIFVGSQSLELPRLGELGAAYFEAAVQSLQGADHVDPGHALYGSVSLFADPFSILIEGKHYRRFFPLSANVDLNRAREYNLVQYNAPPTTEAFYNDTQFESFNVCVSGGRVKTDFHATRDESFFAWLGHYNSWSESASNDRCEIGDDKVNRVWDAALGAELTSQGRKSRASVTLGGRHDTAGRELTRADGSATDLAYQEGYLRYDVIRHIDGPYSLQFQGWHRRRQQTLGGPVDPWWEGQHLTGVELASQLSLAMGIEYNSNELFAAASDPAPDAELPDVTFYFNGQATYRFDSASSVSLFVGQRRGSLRCVGGVCRVFPPFEGARLDATVRF